MASKPSDPMRAALRNAGSAIRTQQALGAAAAVITARTEMAALGCANPSAATRAEMGLMVTEKVDAFAKAGAVVADGAGQIARRSASYAVDETLAAAGAFSRLASCRSPAEAALLQTKLAADFLTRSFTFGLAMNALATRTGDNALRPIHRAVTANEKRLKKKR